MLRKCLYYLFLLTFVFYNVESNCILTSGNKTVDISQLDRVEPWVTTLKTDASHYMYYISLCRPLKFPKACIGSMVCWQDLKNPDQKPEIVIPDIKTADLDINTLNSGYVVRYQNSNQNVSLVLMLTCGPTLGSPTLKYTSSKSIFLTWSTSACCDNKTAASNQIPCYAVDRFGRKIDLTPLMLETGAYSVPSADTDQLLINVCSNIIPETGTLSEKCPLGYPACVINGTTNVASGYGNLLMNPALEEGDDYIELEYHNSTAPVPAGCNNSPSVTIRFTCPTRRSTTNSPRLMFKEKCSYMVEWLTDYACPTTMMRGTNCTMGLTEHGLDIDLKSLYNGEEGYTVDGMDENGNQTKYHMRICGPLTTRWEKYPKCRGSAASIICKDGDEPITVGASYTSELYYGDGNLYLLMDMGSTCTPERKYVTKIQFICTPSIEKGQPKFISVNNCEYTFIWRTHLACPRHKHPSCVFTSGGLHFDLLNLNDRTYWSVIGDDKMITDMLIHPCLPLHTHNLNYASCPIGSSFCEPGFVNSINFGSIVKGPFYNTTSKAIEVYYGNGNHCKGKSTAFLSMTCNYDNIYSSPHIDYTTADGCHYYLSWRTYLACPLHTVVGRDCWVTDKASDQHFNLKALARDSYYEVKDYNTTYILNLCQPVKNHTCADGNVGLCQVTKGKATGLASYSTTVHYTSNGMMRLFYGDKLQLVMVCEPKAGKGYPRLVANHNGLLMMEWKSSIACPITTRICHAFDNKGGEIIDLTPLAVNGPYKIVKKNYEIYYSICGPLGADIPYCDPEASVCMVNTTGGVSKRMRPNMGMDESSLNPVVKMEGHVLIKYENGMACGGGRNMTTLLNILCATNPSHDGWIEDISGTSNCTKTLLLMSIMACSLRQSRELKTQCMVEDAITGRLINLRPLAKRGPLNASNYQVSLCAPPQGGLCGNPNATVCLNGKPMALSNSTYVEKRYQEIILTYTGSESLGTKAKKYEIELICPTQSNYSHHLMLKREHEELTVFSLYTPLACSPMAPSCTFTDSDNLRYNLAPLGVARNTTLDIKDKKNALNYTTLEFTLCGLLEGNRCDGPSSACLLPPPNSNQTKGFNLGYPLNIPTKSKAQYELLIEMVYTGGDPCPSNTTHTASAKIFLLCSGTQSDSKKLTLIGVTKNCQYTFLMSTIHACPLKQDDNEGGDCTVIDHRNDKLFDLRSLRKSQEEAGYPVEEMPGLVVNVCGPLKGDQAGNCYGAGACVNTTNLGMASQNLKLVSGELKLTYKDGSTCSRGMKRRTEIEFVCLDQKYSLKENTIRVLNLDEHSCTTNLIWYTSLACINTQTSCLAGTYDLSLLTQKPNEKPYEMDIGGGNLMIINVCHSLDHPDKRCQGSGSCIILPDNSTVSAGRPSSLFLEDDRPVLVYTSGSPCPSNALKTISTRIEFSCSSNSMSEGWGLPEYNWMEDCEHVITWDTPLACPIEEPTVTEDCKIASKVNKGYYFDLHPLSSSTKKLTTKSNREFYLNICDDKVASYTPCGAKVGACEWNNGTYISTGLINSRLVYRGEYITLMYIDGQSCNNNTDKITTIIEFVCATNESISYLEDMENECTRVFLVKTPLACYKSPQCNLVHEGHYYSFEKEGSKGYTIVDDPNDPAIQYYISLCRPLDVPNCPKGSGVCMMNNTVGTNMGRPNGDLIVSFTKELTLIYDQGDPCLDEHGSRYRTVITFACDPADNQKPVVFKHSACIMEFMWYSSSACPHKDMDANSYMASSCVFSSDADSPTYSVSDLKPPSPTSPYEVALHDGRKLLVSLCVPMALKEQNNPCRGSTMCLVKNTTYTSLGKHLNLKWLGGGKLLTLKYENGSDCVMGENGKGSSYIQFACDPTAGLGQPQARAVTQCHARVYWPTSKVCQQDPILGCMFTLNGRQYDLFPLSSYSASRKVVDPATNNTYQINICRKVNGDFKGCDKNAAVCMKPGGNDNNYQTLALPNLQSVSLNAAGELVMSYYGGSPCNDTYHSVQITFKCGKEFGSPKLLSVLNCVHMFEWTSYHACDEDETKIEEKWGTLFDRRILKAMDVSALLNSSFVVSTGDRHYRDQYLFYINLASGGQAFKELEGNQICANSGVCQAKNNSQFYRDVGSYSTRSFYLLNNSSVILTLTSRGRICGKTKLKNVTSVIHLSCSEKDGLGAPEFSYESGHCNYIFDWETDLVCPRNIRDMTVEEWEEFVKNGPNVKPPTPPSPSPQIAGNHQISLIVGLCVLIIVALPILYILSSPERRIHASMRFKNIFTKVRMPKLLYRKVDGQTYLISPVDNSNLYDSDEGDSFST